MADSKGTRSHKRKKAVPTVVPEAAPRALPAPRFVRFPEVKGKIIDAVEIDPDGESIVMMFQDNTSLSFDLDPRLSLFPELSEIIRGDVHVRKRWEPVHTKSSILRWL